VREFFRLNRQNFSGEWDLNVVAKKKAAGISSQKVFDSLYALFSEISKNDGS
jgi:RNase P protein component